LTYSEETGEAYNFCDFQKKKKKKKLTGFELQKPKNCFQSPQTQAVRYQKVLPMEQGKQTKKRFSSIS